MQKLWLKAFFTSIWNSVFNLPSTRLWLISGIYTSTRRRGCLKPRSAIFSSSFFNFGFQMDQIGSGHNELIPWFSCSRKCFGSLFVHWRPRWFGTKRIVVQLYWITSQTNYVRRFPWHLYTQMWAWIGVTPICHLKLMLWRHRFYRYVLLYECSSNTAKPYVFWKSTMS